MVLQRSPVTDGQTTNVEGTSVCASPVTTALLKKKKREGGEVRYCVLQRSPVLTCSSTEQLSEELCCSAALALCAVFHNGKKKKDVVDRPLY